MAKICMVGEWHQAVVSGSCLADAGHSVTGVASDSAAVQRLVAATPPVHEPELPDIMRRALESGRLSYTTSFEAALRDADFACIALDTPITSDDTPELGPVVAAARGIARGLTGDITLVVTAQVPVGTCGRLRDLVAAESGFRIGVACVPEFLRLGQAVRTFIDADRFIIGCDDDTVAHEVAAIYAPFGRPLLHTSVRSAEMTKHACNAFLAASISFANEIADLCGVTGADIDAVTTGMKLDRRIGADAFLSAGLGFAGGTLGRDLRALQGIGAEQGIATRIVDAALAVNDSRYLLVRRHLERMHGELSGRRAAVLGLTYKRGTSTMRRSIALEIIRDLTACGVDVAAFDPLADMDDVNDPPPFTRMADPYAAAQDADAVILVTEWDAIDELDLDALRACMRHPVFIDTRNRFDAAAMAKHGFLYAGVGRTADGSGGERGERVRAAQSVP